MRIDSQKRKELEDIYLYFFHHEKIQQMKDVEMHRGSDTFLHSFKVAKLAIKRASRHKNINLESVLIASILHDYYLYDWRRDKSKRKRHGKNHPFIAANNAKADFDITDEIQNIIKQHMWPINLKQFPKTKEARIVNLADDHIALQEALTSRKYKEKRKQKYMDYLSHLF